MIEKRGIRTFPAKLIRTVVYLQPEEYEAMKLAAVEREVASSEIMRQALRRFLGLAD